MIVLKKGDVYGQGVGPCDTAACRCQHKEVELDLCVAKSVQQPASPEELCNIASDN